MSLFDRVNNFVLGVLLIVIGFSILNTVYGSWPAKGYTIKNGSLEVDESLPNSKVIKASWYGKAFHGRLTASGIRYNMHSMVAAHKTLPFGTKVKLRNPKNGKIVVVTVVDRGPFIKGRSIDLSKAANDKLKCGLCKLEMQVLKVGDGKYKRSRG